MTQQPSTPKPTSAPVPTAAPSPTPMTKKNKTLIIAITSISVVVFIGIVALAITIGSLISGNHDWNQGFAPQNSQADISAIKTAISATKADNILDFNVKNTNTSGTPFGHTISVYVLLDASQTNLTYRDAFVSVVKGINNAGIQETYNIAQGFNIDKAIKSGPGSPSEPVTDVQSLNFYAQSTSVQKEFNLPKSDTFVTLTWEQVQRIASS